MTPGLIVLSAGGLIALGTAIAVEVSFRRERRKGYRAALDAHRTKYPDISHAWDHAPREPMTREEFAKEYQTVFDPADGPPPLRTVTVPEGVRVVSKHPATFNPVIPVVKHGDPHPKGVHLYGPWYGSWPWAAYDGGCVIGTYTRKYTAMVGARRYMAKHGLD